ncbi:MAG: M28 family peptidase [Comamonadaceae bacterium]|nr:MAG: M28 family peptidase [Comamonadaceae bacterium]
MDHVRRQALRQRAGTHRRLPEFRHDRLAQPRVRRLHRHPEALVVVAEDFLDGGGGRSDHVPFAEAGIPHGGLYTGAEEIKTPAEAAIWGGTAGAALDPCYHLRCDGLANLNLAALAVNADLVAAAVLHFGMHVPGR